MINISKYERRIFKPFTVVNDEQMTDDGFIKWNAIKRLNAVRAKF